MLWTHGWWGQNTFGANVNRDLEGRTISYIRHLVTSSMTARGSCSIMRVFGGLVSYDEICHGEVPVVKCNNICRACKNRLCPLYIFPAIWSQGRRFRVLWDVTFLKWPLTDMNRLNDKDLGTSKRKLQIEKVKQFHYRPELSQRVPGGSGSQISRQSAHESG